MQQTLDTHSRLLPLQACFNGRDLGGLRNQQGLSIKPQRLLRADDLSSLSEEDLSYLHQLPLHTVIDFRSDLEQHKKPDLLPASCQQHLHFDILSGSMQVYMQQMKEGTALARDIMLDVYRDLLLNPNSQQQYRQFLIVFMVLSQV